MREYDEIINLLPSNIRKQASEIIKKERMLQEIRLRVNEYAVIICNRKEYFLQKDSGVRISENDIRECFKRISEYSVYAYEEELKNGYITIKGGHRVGIAGKVILDNGHVKNIRYVSFINIRVSRQIKGCSDKIISNIYYDSVVHNTLIISPPGGGKTTLLRDIIRNISSGYGNQNGVNVGVVDERSEICACYRGIPQNDVGIRTDILDACPKAEGIVRLIRSMSPKVIAVDEIGTKDDIMAVEYAMVSGCGVIATIHGCGMEDICNNYLLRKSIEERKFSRFILLPDMSSVGKVVSIRDEKGRELHNGS